MHPRDQKVNRISEVIITNFGENPKPKTGHSKFRMAEEKLSSPSDDVPMAPSSIESHLECQICLSLICEPVSY